MDAEAWKKWTQERFGEAKRVGMRAAKATAGAAKSAYDVLKDPAKIGRAVGGGAASAANAGIAAGEYASEAGSAAKEAFKEGMRGSASSTGAPQPEVKPGYTRTPSGTITPVGENFGATPPRAPVGGTPAGGFGNAARMVGSSLLRAAGPLATAATIAMSPNQTGDEVPPAVLAAGGRRGTLRAVDRDGPGAAGFNNAADAEDAAQVAATGLRSNAAPTASETPLPVRGSPQVAPVASTYESPDSAVVTSPRTTDGFARNDQNQIVGPVPTAPKATAEELQNQRMGLRVGAQRAAIDATGEDLRIGKTVADPNANLRASVAGMDPNRAYQVNTDPQGTKIFASRDAKGQLNLTGTGDGSAVKKYEESDQYKQGVALAEKERQQLGSLVREAGMRRDNAKAYELAGTNPEMAELAAKTLKDAEDRERFKGNSKVQVARMAAESEGMRQQLLSRKQAEDERNNRFNNARDVERLQIEADKAGLVERNRVEEIQGKQHEAAVDSFVRSRAGPMKTSLIGSNETKDQFEARIAKDKADLQADINFTLGDRQGPKKRFDQLSNTEREELFLAKRLKDKVTEGREGFSQKLRDYFGAKRFDSRNLDSFVPVKAEPAKLPGSYVVHFKNGNTAEVSDLQNGKFNWLGPNEPIDSDIASVLRPILEKAKERK